jgi:hypothetical protein
MNTGSTPNPEILAGIPGRYATPDPALVSKLPRYTGPRSTPRDQRQRGRCDVCGGWHELQSVHLDYVGHADVTLMLLDVDPLWTLEPVSWEPNGGPVIERRQDRLILWCWLTVAGHRRLCVGTCDADKSDPEKELLGDALRNGALRFGFATALWSKSERPESVGEAPQSAPERRETPPPAKRASTVRTAPRAPQSAPGSPNSATRVRRPRAPARRRRSSRR